MRVRDGPAAVRGDAPPPRSHWRKPGRRRGREPRVRRPVALLIARTPRGREDSGASLFSSRRRLALAAALAAARRRRVPAAAPSRQPPSFPVTIVASNGKVTVAKQPRRIVSLSPTATESLFAIGAGSQVVAVDDQSDYPKSAPRTSLSGFTPERRGDRRLPARPRRHRLRPEGPLGRARAARDHRRPPRRRADVQGRVPADPPARARHRPRGRGDAADRPHEGEDRAASSRTRARPAAGSPCTTS